MRGTAYGIGVGPGDPELMTLKAVRLIRACGVIAVPGREPRESAAYKIALGAVPELEEKVLVPLEMPMTRDREMLERAHRAAARRIEAHLDRGLDVACLTLGDPSVYSTFAYLLRCLEADGYEARMIPGVPSFCAAAARLNMPLAAWDEPLRVIPAAHRADLALEAPGTCVLMKPAGRMAEVKEALRKSGRRAGMVENCGMAGEKVYRSVDEMPDSAGYFSIVIAREDF